MPTDTFEAPDVKADPATRRLVRALTLSARFHFYLVSCSGYPAATAIIAAIEADVLPERGEGVQVVRIDPYTMHNDFTAPIAFDVLLSEVLEKLASPLQELARAGTIVVVDGTRAAAVDDRAWQLLFMRMNERRNVIKSRLAGELVLLVTPRLEDIFARAAPDFWSIRSGEYRVEAVSVLNPVADDMADGIRFLGGGHASAAPPPSSERVGGAAELRRLSLALKDEGNAALRAGDAGRAKERFQLMQEVLKEGLASEPDSAEWLTLMQEGLVGAARAFELMGDRTSADVSSTHAEHVRQEKIRPERAARLEQQRSDTLTSRPASSARAYTSEPKRLCVSFSQQDAGFVDELRSHLAILERRGLIHPWYVREIGPGADWKTVIDSQLREADLVLFMVSPSFLASEYVNGAEVQLAMARHQSGDALVVPVILHPCAWQAAPFGALRALPTDGPAITSWPDRDVAWSDVAEALQRLLLGMGTVSRTRG